MASIWEDHGVVDVVLDALRDVAAPLGAHHMGRPFISAYQLAIQVERRAPQVRQALDQPLGGAGAGARNSLAQYLAKQLSDRIKRDPRGFPIEGAFISSEDVLSLNFDGPNGPVTSSLTDSGFDLSLFRIRP
jgi:hypothetical protein